MTEEQNKNADELGIEKEMTFTLTPFENGVVLASLWCRKHEICERIARKLYDQFMAQAGPR